MCYGNFAVPTRISATVSPGRDEDLLDIERVAEQADSDHVRGELTIEGFWELCRQRRAQGEQSERGYGVVIPAVNQRDLMLRAEVADAIAREGWFAIWPVSTVDEALEVLMGVPAAEVHARVERRLQQFHAQVVASHSGR